jgi:hypothetical protein
MRARARRRVAIAAIGSMLLSGCWLFPPFMPPLEPGTRTYVVENATDTDWVLELRSDFSTAYAIPAGETGTVDDWSTATEAIVLMTDACEEIDEIGVTSETAAVRIEDPGELAEADASASGLEPFIEYWNCPGGFGSEPLGVAELPGATGSILVYGEDGLPYVYEPTTGTIEPALPGGDPAFFDTGHTWSPDGTRIAYAHSTETSLTTSIYVANADGTDAQLIAEDAMSPLWSPDGQRIAYLDGDPFVRDPGIWVIDLETEERVQVAEGVGAFSWSPDGSRFAYVSGVAFSMDPELTPTEVHIVNADDGSTDIVVGTSVPYSFAPAWSPDGSRLAFPEAPADLDPDEFAYASSIAVYDVDSGELTTVASVEDASFVEPAWSPNGSRIAFSASELSLFSSTAYLGIVDADGGEITRYSSDDTTLISTPWWSPDGAWVVASVQTGADLSSVLVGIDPTDADSELIALATGVLSVLAWRAE